MMGNSSSQSLHEMMRDTLLRNVSRDNLMMHDSLSRNVSNVSLTELVRNYSSGSLEAVMEQGEATGFMCAYPAVNGVPACASEWALQELLVAQWGFDGYVVSDCLALQVRVAAAHRETLTIAQARVSLFVRARARVRRHSLLVCACPA